MLYGAFKALRVCKRISLHQSFRLSFHKQGMEQENIEHIEVVTDLERCEEIVKTILTAKYPVALDCEGKNLGVGGRITLVQIAVQDGHAFLFDVFESPDLMRGGLRDLLQHPNLVKVIHACAGDSCVLHEQFGVTLNNIFDTQVADGLIIRERSQLLSTAQRSLNDVVQQYGGQTNLEKKHMKKNFRNPNFWMRRPLTHDMQFYAASDVTALVPNVYENIRSELQSLDVTREFDELCDENLLQNIRPEEVKRRRKQRAHLTERTVLQSVASRCSDGQDLCEFSERERLVLMRQDPRDGSVSQGVMTALRRLYLEKVDSIEKSVAQAARKPLAVNTLFSMRNFLISKGSRHDDGEVKARAAVALEHLEPLLPSLKKKL